MVKYNVYTKQYYKKWCNYGSDKRKFDCNQEIMICLTFKNNSGLLNSGTAILLLNGITELTVSTSSLKFSYNKATLSGGITFQNTRMFVYSFVKAEF